MRNWPAGGGGCGGALEKALCLLLLPLFICYLMPASCPLLFPPQLLKTSNGKLVYKEVAVEEAAK